MSERMFGAGKREDLIQPNEEAAPVMVGGNEIVVGGTLSLYVDEAYITGTIEDIDTSQEQLVVTVLITSDTHKGRVGTFTHDGRKWLVVDSAK